MYLGLEIDITRLEVSFNTVGNFTFFHSDIINEGEKKI